jgi:hypothetical protein
VTARARAAGNHRRLEAGAERKERHHQGAARHNGEPAAHYSGMFLRLRDALVLLASLVHFIAKRNGKARDVGNVRCLGLSIGRMMHVCGCSRDDWSECQCAMLLTWAGRRGRRPEGARVQGAGARGRPHALSAARHRAGRGPRRHRQAGPRVGPVKERGTYAPPSPRCVHWRCVIELLAVDCKTVTGCLMRSRGRGIAQ